MINWCSLSTYYLIVLSAESISESPATNKRQTPTRILLFQDLCGIVALKGHRALALLNFKQLSE